MDVVQLPLESIEAGLVARGARRRARDQPEVSHGVVYFFVATRFLLSQNVQAVAQAIGSGQAAPLTQCASEGVGGGALADGAGAAWTTPWLVSSSVPAPSEGLLTDGNDVGGVVRNSAPFWKNSAPGPVVGTDR